MLKKRHYEENVISFKELEKKNLIKLLQLSDYICESYFSPLKRWFKY